MGEGTAELLQAIERVLDAQVRPELARHGGGVRLLSAQSGTVRVQLLGPCAHCPSSYLTVEGLILARLRSALPWVERVLAESVVSDELLAQAKRILRGHG